MRLISVSEALEREDLSPRRVAANHALVSALRSWGPLLPAWLAPPSPDGIYLETDRAEARRLWLIARVVGLALALFAASYLLTLRLLRLAPFQHTVRLQQTMLLLLVLGVAALGFAQGFYFSKLAVLLVALGWLAAGAKSGRYFFPRSRSLRLSKVCDPTAGDRPSRADGK
ncbi:hypothetical protein [Thiobacter aerophilum]|uniref:Uncharacterized protein n=1 Tax=Thiobacter aerophilum TaxID=3121275 RepID=A0ABV0EDT7_9BURK